MNDILKIGEVIEVRGKNVRAKIFSQKNSAVLLYDGKLIKNVSVGSYIKITKGYSNIIGRIEGEYIKENPFFTNLYSKKEERIERIVEISIVGTLDNDGEFKHGITEMPLVANEVYILQEIELQRIFTFYKFLEESISIGQIIGYRDYELRIDIDKLFASHIGIFGNTGSGKSNTLARIYSNLFNHYSNKQSLIKNSHFLIIDFNGEYGNTFAKDYKKVYKLSTRSKKGDKYPIKKQFILDEEFWSIVTEATLKTQRPFIGRVVNRVYKILNSDDMSRVKNSICEMVKKLFDKIYENGYRYNLLKGYIIDVVVEGFKIDENNVKTVLNKIGYHNKQAVLYAYADNLKRNGVFFHAQEDFDKYVSDITSKLVESNVKIENNRDFLQVFKFAINLQYTYEIFSGFSVEEHIAPLMKRFQDRFREMEKVFYATDVEPDTNIEIISLLDVNVKMKKLIPLLVCKQTYDVQKKSFDNKKSLHIIIDEAHNILSYVSERESSIWKDYRLEIFEEIIKEGRKFGTFLTLASQRPSDISPTLISQLHNYFLHRLVNNEDIKSIGKIISFLDNASYDMIPILPQGVCIITGTAMNFPVVVQIKQLPKEEQPKSKTISLKEIWK